MSRILGGVLAVMLALPALAADDKPKDKPQTPKEQYQALVKEYNDAMQEFQKAYGAAKTQEERNKVFNEKYPKADKLAPKFLELAEKNPKDPAAVDALLWVINNDRNSMGKDSSQAKAIKLLSDHVDSDKLGPVCQTLANGYDKAGTELLRAILEKNPNKDVQADACLALAQRLNMRIQVANFLKRDPENAKRFEQALGKETADDLAKLDVAKTEEESGKLFKQFAEKYAADMKADRLAQLCQNLGRQGGASGESLLRSLLEKDKRPEVQGMACLALGQSLKSRADGMPASQAKEAEKLLAESEKLLERCTKDYADVKGPFGKTVGEQAKPVLFEVQHLSIGKEAPEIQGEDADSKKFKLSEYRGKVVLLDFWGNW
jgi:hypothetical protein